MRVLLKFNFLKYLIFFNLMFQSISYAEESAVFPLPNPASSHEAKTKLGALLYRETVFSENYSLSCNSCHSLQKNGIDQLATYAGLGGKKGNINTPTILNSKLNFRQFWNGRAKNFSEAIDDHIADKTVFSSSWPIILKRLSSNDAYLNLFTENFPNGKIDETNVKDALIAFLDNLVTPKSPFDEYLNGNTKAISDDAKKGFELFKQYGCITCHQGSSLGGNLYQKLGIYKDYYFPTESNPVNLGLYSITKDPNDKFVFKVPSLRNITLTGPYLHDGSVKTLEEMVNLMGIYQVGQPLSDTDIKYIVQFLSALNGQQENK